MLSKRSLPRPRSEALHAYRLSALLVSILATLASFLCPANLSAADYLLFAGVLSGKTEILEMDNEGNLQFRESHEAGGNGGHLVASPDGRFVAATSMYAPRISLFEVGPGGSTATPLYLNNHIPVDDFSHSNYAAFNVERSMLYVGSDVLTRVSISETEKMAETVGEFSDTIKRFRHLAYSPSANVLLATARTGDRRPVIYSLRILEDGSFGGLVQALKLDDDVNDNIESFAVSPDGRWAVAGGTYHPALQLIRILPDGTLRVTHQLNLPTGEGYGNGAMAFTPDSRRLLLAGGGRASIKLFKVDEASEQLIVQHTLFIGENGPAYGGQRGIAITPDGRYVALCDQYGYTNQDIIWLVRIHENGFMEYLPGKDFVISPRIEDLAFVGYSRASTGEAWTIYE